MCSANREWITPSKAVRKNPCAIMCGNLFFLKVKNFRGKKWITNFPRTLSLEISQKNLSYFREKVLREIISIKLVIEKSWRKSQDKYKISEMNARLLRRSACVSKQNGDNRGSFVVEKAPTRDALKYNRLRTHILRRPAPGGSSAAPRGSLSWHIGCLLLKDARCTIGAPEEVVTTGHHGGCDERDITRDI